MDIINCILVGILMTTLFCATEGRVVAVATPVLFTNNDGGGPDEIQVPNGAQTTKQFSAGGQVTNAWYTPYDNIYDLSAIATIDVRPAGENAELVVGGYQQPRNGRVRIKIYAEIVS